MNNQQVLDKLMHAEHEGDVVTILDAAGYSVGDDSIWVPLGQNTGNFSVVGNQQENASAAFIEKVVNSIDAVLMAECYRQGIDPESSQAPASMQDAVAKFFDVSGGRLENLLPSEQTQLADRIHVVATGAKADDLPCYCIVDRGEGQTPNQFPDTFLSTSRSSPKIKIDFVQGKFNAGGSGSLQFCGKHNIQLIVSRRQPYAVPPDDDSGPLWGFTIVRRRRPRKGERSSVFVYLAPDGGVLRFAADAIRVLPGSSSKNKPAEAYAGHLDYGTAVKLYNYKLGASGIATLETKRKLERALHTPCLPFRISETRGYRANYYATTVVGVWQGIVDDVDRDEESRTMEGGFPAKATIALRDVGELPIRIGVWRSDVRKRSFPTGVFFLVNGQVHGQLGGEFVSRRLKLDYIRNHLLVSVDCTRMDRSVAEDLFMASRDRLRRNDHYEGICTALARELAAHQGLRDLNAARRKERFENAADGPSDIATMIGELIMSDPGLANLFGFGGKIVTSFGPGLGRQFKGRKFPTYFRLAKRPKKGLLRKKCPVNRTVKVEFETDAENDYFDRATVPGEICVQPGLDLIEASNLWNGKFTVRFRVPWESKSGDLTRVRMAVTDVERVAKGPFVSEFELVATDEVLGANTTHPTPHSPESEHGGKGDGMNPSLKLPTPRGVRKAEWGNGFGIQGPYDSFRVKVAPDGGYDFYFNEDCAWLLTEASKHDADQVRHWFMWGLALSALGMIRQAEEGYESGADLEGVGRACDGIARVIIPMFRVLHELPKVP